MGNCTGICGAKEDAHLEKKFQNEELDNVIRNTQKDIQQIDNSKFQSQISSDKHQEKKNYPGDQAAKKQIIQVKGSQEEIDIDMNFMKENEDKIVKLQANVKGHLERLELFLVQGKKEIKKGD